MRRAIVKTLVFLMLVSGLVVALQSVFLFGPFETSERIARDTHSNFKNQEQGSLDVVYVGASNVYAFWQPPLAWRSYGIASCNYTSPSMPAAAIRYVIKNCRKTQPDALYIVNVSNFKDEGEDKFPFFHFTTDDMPLSWEKISLVRDLTERLDLTFSQQMELYFPILTYHSTWDELTPDDFGFRSSDVESGSTNPGLFITKDISKSFEKHDAILAELNDGLESQERSEQASLEGLLAYCEEEDVNILFVLQPQAVTDKAMLTQLNDACDLIRERGFDLVDLSDPDAMDLDPVVDFLDEKHTNIHGAIKYTDTLARHLVSAYQFEDKRGDSAYATVWDPAVERYVSFIQTKVVLDYELDLPRCNTRRMVSDLRATKTDQGASLSWEPVQKVTTYLVYRRQPKSISNPALEEDLNAYTWTRIAELDASQTTYEDQDVRQSGKYEYKIVPVYQGPRSTIYGSYAVQPVSVEWEVG